jgi:hypothetical protein
MAEAIRLDKSKPYGENHGDMGTDDPLYNVAYWQGGKMGDKKINLPFDVDGNLVPDDGKTEPFPGRGFDNKGNSVTVNYNPLYSKDMRDYLRARLNRATALAEKQPDPLELDDESNDGLEGLAPAPEDDVNFASWLKGEMRYRPHQLRSAALKRFSKRYDPVVPNLIIDLVRDYQDIGLPQPIISEDELSVQFRAVLQRHDKQLESAR